MSQSHSGCNQNGSRPIVGSLAWRIFTLMISLQVIRGEVRRFFDNFPYVKILQYSADVSKPPSAGLTEKQNIGTSWILNKSIEMAISKSTNWHQKMWPWPTWLFHPAIKIGSFGAGNRTRTGDPQLGRLMLWHVKSFLKPEKNSRFCNMSRTSVDFTDCF